MLSTYHINPNLVKLIVNDFLHKIICLSHHFVMCGDNNGLTEKKGSKSRQFLHKTFFVKSIKSHEVTNLLSISDCKGL